MKLKNRVFDNLVKAKKKDRVTLVFNDGRVVDGMIIFNEIKQAGRLINVKKEISIDFSIEDIKDVR